MNNFFSFLSLFICMSSCGEFSYCLPIGFCYDKRLLCYYVARNHSSLIIVENIQAVLEFEDETLEGFPSIIPFSVFPVQPVMFFDKKGFSYFDQGILKSKHFAFRSPGSIYTSIPFDHTMGLHWYCHQHGILSVLKNNFYVVYDLCLDSGNMKLRVDNSTEKSHSIFPFAFKESIFYVLESPINSKIIVQTNTNKSTVLFETDCQSKIVFFAFLDSRSGIFSLYSSHDILSRNAVFHFYKFNYDYSTMVFEKSYCCSVQVPFKVLEEIAGKNLFPWCFLPIESKGKFYLFQCIDQKISLKELV